MKEARKVLLVKTETTAGEDALPTPAADALASIDFQAIQTTTNRDTVEYTADYYGSGDSYTISANRTIGFTLPMVGSGTAGALLPAPMMAVLQACGHSVTVVEDTSVTLKPTSEDEPSATVYVYIDGYRRKLRMARGNVRWVLEEDRIGRVTVENFIGLYDESADAVAGATAFATLAKPVAFNKSNTTMKFGGIDLKCSRIEFNAGRTHTYRNITNAEDIMLENVASTAQIVCELPRVADLDLYAIQNASDRVALECVHGKTAGRIITLSAPAAIITNIAESNVKGQLFATVDLELRPVTGDDQYSIVLT